MKILYGIQGTGHGHISRAREILPLLSNYADIDILISGYNCKMELEDFRVMRRRGISFEYDSQGSVSVLDTALNIKPIRFLQDVQNLSLDEYDLVISDYEPIVSWASVTSKTPCIGLSHQAAFLSDKSPRPEKKSLVAEQVMRHFAPCTTPIGFHFKRYDTFIEPPIIRQQILDLSPVSGDHITVYLPAFDHETLASVFSTVKNVRWEIFSPFCDTPSTKGNITVNPVGNIPFLKSFESSIGVVTSGGFETCAEAMYMGKKLMVIPIKNQYEQLCNAAALREMGIPVIYNWGADVKKTISEWINESEVVMLPEKADTPALVKKLVAMAGREIRKAVPA
jgi:uncharacterized protein (TIGR00661 family)